MIFPEGQTVQQRRLRSEGVVSLRGGRRRLLLSLLWVLLWFTAGCIRAPETVVLAESGTIDLRDIDIAASGPITLNGEWNFWWRQLHIPSQLPMSQADTLWVPESWSDQGKPLITRVGYGTYRLQVLLPEGTPQVGLRIGRVASSRRVWLNGRLVSQVGTVSTEPSEVVANTVHEIHEIWPEDASLEVVIQAANRQHRVSGLRHDVILGTPAQIQNFHERILLQDLLHFSILMGMGFTLLLVWSTQRYRRHWFYVGLFCGALAIRTLVAGNGDVGLLLFPSMSWNLLVRIEYLANAACLVTGFEMLCLKLAVNRDLWRYRLTRYISYALLCFYLISPVEIFLLTLSPLQTTMLIAASLILLELVIAVFERPLSTVGPILVAMLIFSSALVHDVLRANGVVMSTFEMTPTAFLGLLMLEGVSLMRSYVLSFQRVEQLSDKLSIANQSLEITNRAVSRFVPFRFLDLLGKRSVRDIRRGDNVNLMMNVLFCDLRSFTTLIEGLGEDQAFPFINRYLRYMEPAIYANNGFINQYLGDCIMALFPGEPEDAIRASLGMVKELEVFNTDSDGPRLQFGIGIGMGRLMMGTIGGMDRLDSGVIGDTVNRAARIESLTKRYGAILLLGERAYGQLSDDHGFTIREVDQVILKGKTTALRLYEVLDALPPEIGVARKATLASFRAGREAWCRGALAEAQAAFTACLQHDPSDLVAQIYLRRCAEWQGKPLPADWTGITALDQK